MREAAAYKALKKNVIILSDRIDRVENRCISGMPDVNFCIKGVEGWVEIKCPFEPIRTSTPLFGSNHQLSQDQANWFLRQRKAGGSAHILICSDKRWILMGGSFVDCVNKMTLSELIENCAWTTTKPVRYKMQWKYLREALIK